MPRVHPGRPYARDDRINYTTIPAQNAGAWRGRSQSTTLQPREAMMSATRRRTHRKAFRPSCESLEGRQLLNGTPQSLHIGTVYDSLTYGKTLGYATNPTTVEDANGNAVSGNFDYTDGSNDVTDTVLNVGHYDLSVTFNPTDTTDYNSVTTTASIDITKAQLQITAADATRVYGQDNPDLTSEIYIAQGTGWVDTGQSWTADTTATTKSPVGSYAIQPTEITDQAFLTNYDVSYVTGKLTLTPATPVITWARPTDITYGTALGATQLNATASVAGTFDYGTLWGKVLHAGTNQTLSVNFTPDDTVDYNQATATVYIDVKQAPLKILSIGTVSDILTYGTTLGSAINPTTVQDANGNAVTGTFDFKNGAADVTDSVLDVGHYDLAVTFNPTDTTDYSSATTTASIDITKAKIAIVADSPPDITYGNSSPTLTNTLYTDLGPDPNYPGQDDYQELDSTDLASVAYTNALGSAPAATTDAILSAGDHTINPTDISTLSPTTASSEFLNDFDVVYGTGTLTVTPATLTVTANSATKTYGDAVTFAGTEFTTDGLVNGDSVSGVTLTSDGAAATAQVSGSPYAIVASDAAGSGLSNYTISYTNGSLTVSQKALTVTANSATKTYGDAVTFAGTEFTTDGLVNGDSVSGVSLTSDGAAATAQVSGSPYAIVASDAAGSGLSNYTISYTNGSLTVSQKALTVTANSATKTYGGAVTFAGTEFTTDGLVNGDSVSGVSLTSDGAAATAQVSGSPYAIVASDAAGSGLSNYTISYTNG